jgi:hypothetical protein
MVVVVAAVAVVSTVSNTINKTRTMTGGGMTHDNTHTHNHSQPLFQIFWQRSHQFLKFSRRIGQIL